MMKSIAKLMFAVTLLIWSRPAHAETVTCQVPYYPQCSALCQQNMQQCTEYCPTQGNYQQYCYTEYVQSGINNGGTGFVAYEDCMEAPASGCMSECVATINNCESNCFSGWCTVND
jgi:hypothetical protein